MRHAENKSIARYVKTKTDNADNERNPGRFADDEDLKIM